MMMNKVLIKRYPTFSLVIVYVLLIKAYITYNFLSPDFYFICINEYGTNTQVQNLYRFEAPPSMTILQK